MLSLSGDLAAQLQIAFHVCGKGFDSHRRRKGRKDVDGLQIRRAKARASRRYFVAS